MIPFTWKSRTGKLNYDDRSINVLIGQCGDTNYK